MLPTFGLKTHIWNTGLRSLLLLAGFPVLLLLITWAFTLLMASGGPNGFWGGLKDSIAMLPAAFPVALLLAGLWFAIAWFANQRIIDAVSGAKRVTREQERLLWDTTEHLAISRGMRMPRMAVIETEAMNAYASGLTLDQGAITVTRGLLNALSPAELRAVLAHELTHIRNGDARLAVVAAVFAGIISVAGELMLRGFGRFGARRAVRRSSSSSNSKGGAGALVLVALAVAALAWVLSIALRMALSRNREYLADAGAVELTADPDAMASALRRITGQSEMKGLPSQLRAMLLDDASSSLGPAWFATHPPIEDRIAALVRNAGARDPGPLAPRVAAPSPAEAALDQALAEDRTVVLPPLSPPAGPSAGEPHSPASSPPANPWLRPPPAPPATG
jgi:heat shock protein HtpX